MAGECGYEFSEDFYTEGHACTLPHGHDGPHRCVLEWETRGADVCRAEGHAWGEWKPFDSASKHLGLWSGWEQWPDATRACSRCGASESQGGKKAKGVEDVLLDSLFRGHIPLAVGHLNHSWRL